jgi:hypothetical protein
MKTATIPAVRIEPQLRDELEQALEEGETLAGLVESAVRHEVLRRKDQAEFVQRGIAEVTRCMDVRDGVPAEVVIAGLEARLAAARRAQEG